jgi:hypothetical protein
MYLILSVLIIFETVDINNTIKRMGNLLQDERKRL